MLSPHGIRGELKCRVVTDFPRARFKRGKSTFIKGERRVIQSARVQDRTVLLKLEGIDDRDMAATFRGADVEIPVDEAVQLPRGQFYWHQVIGLEVEDATTHVSLGQVRDILETGANDVYIVRTAQGKELLIPAIKEVVKEIDPAAGRILIEPLPGLLPPSPP